MSSRDRYLAIDEEGYFVFDGRRVDDPVMGAELLREIKPVETDRFQTQMSGQTAWVEAFDAPYVARHLRKARIEPASGSTSSSLAEIELAYAVTAQFSFESLSVDEWDRFHGVTLTGVPFVLSRAAQIELFDLLDSFDDDSITVAGRRYPVHPFFSSDSQTQASEYWTGRYRNEAKPGWELGKETQILPEILPQLKLAKCRVLVLGCGSGNDAACFARLGHNVTAVDFSPEAIARAKATYGDVDQLEFIEKDVFTLPESWTARFDLVFEHTCFCAIAPERRNDLIQVWKRVLTPNGHVLGVFFVMEKRQGPPFGGSEWELRQRLKRHFEFLYWTRWRRSSAERASKELVAYLRRRS